MSYHKISYVKTYLRLEMLSTTCRRLQDRFRVRRESSCSIPDIRLIRLDDKSKCVKACDWFKFVIAVIWLQCTFNT